jgi:F-type H+-transporting ATPase subunit b
MLDERRRQIAQSVVDTEKITAKLAEAEVHHRELMVQANAEATKFIEEARAGAARLQEQESQKAIAAAEQILAKAREAAAQDYASMLADLKREVGRLVVQTTARVTGKILTPEDQKRLAEETAKQLTVQ